VEAAAARGSSRAEEVAERLHAESRTVGELRLAVQQLHAQQQSALDHLQRVESRLAEYDEGLVGLIEQRIAARVESAVAAALAATRRAAEVDAAKLRDEVRASGRFSQDASARNAALVAAALRTVQRHVDEALDKITSDTLTRVDAADQHVAAVTRDHRQLVDFISSLNSSVASVKGEIAELKHSTAALELRGSHVETETQTLNRRLASALRHLAVDNDATKALINISTTAPPSSSDESGLPPTQAVVTEKLLQATVAQRHARSPGPSSIDSFLAELESVVVGLHNPSIPTAIVPSSTGE
jgi:chromosome segregation ATPase